MLFFAHARDGHRDNSDVALLSPAREDHSSRDARLSWAGHPGASPDGRTRADEEAQRVQVALGRPEGWRCSQVAPRMGRRRLVAASGEGRLAILGTLAPG